MIRDAVAFLAVLGAGLLALQNCAVPTPKTQEITITEGDAAPLPVCTLACANAVAFCPGSVPNTNVCLSVCQARYALTPATMPAVLVCEAEASDKATFVRCGGVHQCP